MDILQGTVLEKIEDFEAEYKNGLENLNFSDTMIMLKKGFKMQRAGWNGKDLFIVLRTGYPNGIPCNKNTAECYNMKENELFYCNPYFQIKKPDNSVDTWVPSVSDLLAEDWKEL